MPQPTLSIQPVPQPSLGEPTHGPVALPLNPYIAGKSLAGDRGFFGRQDIFELVETELARSAIVLFGQRRIGKTSILRQLQRRLREPFIPVYFDLMDRAEKPMGQLLADLAQLMAQGAGRPDLHSPADDTGEQFRQRFLPALYEALGEKRAMVLLLDEFDVLDRTAERQLPATAAARAFFPYLRQLIENERRLHFLVVIGRKTEELSSDFKATFKAARFKRVSVLSTQDARSLVTLAEQHGSLRFAPGVVDALLALTTGHPYLTQLVCQQLWDLAHAGALSASGDGLAVPVVTPELLASVVPRAVEAGQNVFEWIWDGLPPAERVVLAAIAEATEKQAAVTEEQVLELLQRHGVRVLSGDLDLAPRKLVDWELLRMVEGGYSCHVELIRRWVFSQKPLLRVKDEIYRLNPLAERLFLSARDFYALNQPVKTQDHLVEVLQLNPGHLPARLLLARLLQERGELGQAVKELETAWLYDEAAARMPLVGALLAAAEAHERRIEIPAAIAAYERALNLSPGEHVAIEQLLRLRHIRAAAALEAGEWAEALEQLLRLDAYGDKQRPQQIELGREVGLRSEMAESWDTAIKAYRWLQSKLPDDASLSPSTERASRQKELAEHYRNGKEALENRAFSQAIAAFSRIIALAPAYRDAASRLALAVEQQRSLSDPNRATQVQPVPTRESTAAHEKGGRLHRRWRTLGAALLGAVLPLGFLGWYLAGHSKIASTEKQELAAQKDENLLLAAIDSDLQGKRWADAITKANRLLGNPTASAKARDSAVANRARADAESKVQPTYERFLSTGDNYDQALALYREIPSESLYHPSARENYDKLFPLFVEKHLKAAEDARALGRCEEFRSELKVILDLDPKQIKALAAKDRPCSEKTSSSSSETQVASATPEHHRLQRPVAEQPVVVVPELSPKQPEVDPAEADQTLSNAQTEYVNGNFSQAISVAKSVQRINPFRAWRIIGAAACNMKDLKLASEAFKHLDSASRQYLVYTCQRQGIINTIGSQFRLNER